MAIALDGISLTGFRSYQNDQAFHFPKDPGVYMFSGPIGIGKSSIFEGIRWVLTGALSSGLRAKQVANWARTEHTQVVLDIRASGRLRSVTRRFDPNSLTLQYGLDDPRVVDQDSIDRLFGTTAAHVLDAVHMPQRGDSFMSIGAAKQAERVATTLGLDRWDARTKAAKDSAREAGEQLAKAQRVTASKQGALAAIEGSLRQLLALSAGFKRGAAERRRDAQVVAWVGHRDCAARDALSRLQDAQRAARTASAAVAAARKQAERLKPTGTCPTCQSPWKPETLQRARDECAEALAVVEARIEDELGAMNTLGAVEAAQRAAVAAGDAAREYSGRGLRDNAEFEAEIAAIEVTVDEVDPYKPQLKQQAAERKALQAAIGASKKAEHDAEQDQSLAQLAAKTFPRVKLAILSRAAANLTTLTNNALSALGLTSWAVRWSTSTTLGSGESRAKFAMTVQAPGSPDWVDWRAWSGGQSTLLRIAGAAAYADLVRSRLKDAPDFEIWDEPAEFLSMEAGLSVMAFFRHRALTQGLKVWVVDHNTQYAGEVDRHWVVSRRDTGSYIVGT